MTDFGPGAIKRDRYGRYCLPDPETGQERSWTRVTTLASTLADRYGLEKWSQRNIVWGLGQRQDLWARAAAVTIDEKRTLGQIADDAQAAASSAAGANLGTALHQFTERIDRGEIVPVPPPYDKDVAAYLKALADAGVSIVKSSVERIVIVPEFEVVGTLDRVVRGPWRPEGLPEKYDPLPRVADLKTGRDVVKFGMTEIALQLALYANASHWWTGEEWRPMPELDRDKAVVMHLPVGQGKCALYEVDIRAGWEAVQLAVDVRAWRKRKDLCEPIVTWGVA